MVMFFACGTWCVHVADVSSVSRSSEHTLQRIKTLVWFGLRSIRYSAAQCYTSISTDTYCCTYLNHNGWCETSVASCAYPLLEAKSNVFKKLRQHI